MNCLGPAVCNWGHADDCPMRKNMDEKQEAKNHLETLLEHRSVYIQYARHRIDDQHWHGVSDAANDLRELDVEIRMHKDRHGL